MFLSLSLSLFLFLCGDSGVPFSCSVFLFFLFSSFFCLALPRVALRCVVSALCEARVAVSEFSSGSHLCITAAVQYNDLLYVLV